MEEDVRNILVIVLPLMVSVVTKHSILLLMMVQESASIRSINGEREK